MRTPRSIPFLLVIFPALLALACTISPMSPVAMPTLAPRVPNAGPAGSLTPPTATDEGEATASDGPSPVATAEAAGALSPGETVTGTIAQDGAVIWTLQGSAGQMFDVVAEPTDAGLDLLLDVLDEDGRTILPSGEIDSTPDTETIYGLTLPEDGEYQVQLRGFLGSGGGYALTMHPAGSEVGKLASGQLITNSLAAGETQVYSLEGTAGVSLTLLVAPATGLDVAIEVLDAQHSLAAEANDGAEGEGEVLSFLPATTGPYRVRVRELSGNSGAYTLGMVAEAAAQLAESGAVAAGEQVTYTVTVPAGESWLVAAVPLESFDVLVSVLDGEGNLLQTVDAGVANTPELFWLPAPQDAEVAYTLQVSGFEDSDGSFRLLVTGNQEAVTLPTGRPVTISPGEVVTANLRPGTLHSYSFSGRAGTEALFFLIPAGALDPVVQVLGTNGDVLLEVSEGFAGEGEMVRFVPATAGDYTLQVSGSGQSSGEYTAGMVGSTAVLLDQQGTVNAGSAAGYTMMVPTGESRIILLFPQEGFDAILQIRNEEGETVVHADTRIAGEAELLWFRPEQGGQYTVRILGFAGAGGSYRIMVMELP